MATLQRIRNHSVALLVIVGLAMLAFIIGDLLTSSSSIMQSSRDKVVVINGKKVTYEEFEAARQRKQDFVKSMQGQELDNNASQQLTQQVYNEFITKTLLNAACEKFGITVTKDEVNDLVQGQHVSPVLQQMFGQQAPQIVNFFVSVIANDNWEEASQQVPFVTYNNWMEIEDEVVLNREVEKYTSLVAAAIKPNKLEAKDNFDGDNTECSFAYVKQSAMNVADSLVSVSNSDVKEYYASNKRNFKLGASRRNVSYINLALRPSAQDLADAEADIQSLRDEFATSDEVAELVNGNSIVPYVDAFLNMSNFQGELKEFIENNAAGAVMEPHREEANVYMMARIMDKTTAPDSIEVALVIVPTKEEADSIQNVLDKASNATDALASYNQQQKFIGWAEDATLLQGFGNEVRNAIRATATGKTFTQTVNNVFVAGKVTGKTAPVALAKVAIYANEVIPSTRTRGEEYGRLNRFLTTYKSVKQMQDSAMAEGFQMMPTTVYSTSYNVGAIQDARQAVRFAFQGAKGEVSEIFETGDNLLVVAVTGDVEEGYLSLNDSTIYKQVAQYNVMPQKKVEYLAEKFAQVNGSNLSAYAEKFDAKVDTASFVNFNLNSVVGLGAEPQIFEAALKAQEGQVVTVAGKNNVVALQVISKNDKGLEYDEAARLETVARGREYAQAANAALAVLQNEADIEDNRISFY